MARFSLPRLFGSQQRPAKRQQPRSQPRLCLEVLENRLVPSTLHVGSHPGEYHTIQAAVNAAHSNDTIRVDPGTYTEQVVINNNGHARDNLKLEGSSAHSTFIQAPALATMTGHHAIVEVENAQNVTIDGFTIEGPSSAANSGGNFYGIRIDDGSATIENNHITKIEDTPFGGAQEGVAILVGRAADGTTGTAIISQNFIDQYQKGGIVVDNIGSSAEIDHNTIIGQGPTALNTQNGVQISRGATADVSNNRISDNEYTGGGDVGTGVFLFQAGTVRVDQNTLSHNDVGIYDQGSDNVVIEYNQISRNTFNGILLVSTSGAQIDYNTTDRNGSGNSGDGGIALYNSTNNIIASNTSNHNNGDGIFVDSTSTGNTFSQNRLRGNSQFDAEDQSTGTGTAGTGNSWTNNRGQTSNPPGLVS